MKKIMYFFIILVTLICYPSYKIYHKNKIINNCLNTLEESLISNCSMVNRFKDISTPLEATQTAYNFNYNHFNYQFRDKKNQLNFVRSYLNNYVDCKNMLNCDLKDQGKGYYISLNNCLLNDNCIGFFIRINSINCMVLYQEEINKIPLQFQHLITVKKEKFCKNYIEDKIQTETSIDDMFKKLRQNK